MARLAWHVAVTACVFLAIACPPAHAQSRANPGDSKLGRSLHGPAKDAYVAAAILLEHGQYEAASGKYAEAYELSRDPRLIFDMAVCDRNLHAYARMQRHLQRYKDEAAANLSPEDKKVVDDALAALPRFVGTIDLRVEPDGATVAADNEALGTTPLRAPLVLDPGTHTLSVTKDGYLGVDRPIDISAGSATALSLVLTLKATPQPVPSPSPPQTKPQPTTSTRVGVLTYVGFGLAGAGVIVGAVSGGLAMQKASTVTTACEGTTCPRRIDGDLQSGRLLAGVSTVSFIVAAAGACVGVADLFFLHRKPTATPEASLMPFISVGGAGVRGVF